MDALHAASGGERRRYYIASQDIRRKLSYELLNKHDILIGGVALGNRRVQLRNLDFYYHVGIPELCGKPILKLGGRYGRDSALDFYGDQRFFSSNRLKNLLLQFDEGAFELVECDTVDARGNQMEAYWWMEAVRVLDAVDESRSDIIRQVENPFSRQENVDLFRYYKINDVFMKSDVVKDYHVFRLTPYGRRMIVSSDVVDECRKQKITGILFTPLQPPTALDRKQHLLFENYPYWTNRDCNQ